MDRLTTLVALRWRLGVRTAMGARERLLALMLVVPVMVLLSAAAEIDVPGSSFNYRWEHVTNVVTLALKLADLVGADREVVEAAAWLHDVTKRDGESHATSGAIFARDFLPQTDFPPEKIDVVARAIADHKGTGIDQRGTPIIAGYFARSDNDAFGGVRSLVRWRLDWH